MIPVLRMPLPRPVTAIHQIELTSHCNLRCVYCTSPNLQREKLNMDMDILDRALKHVRYFLAKKSPQQALELNLAGIGESTLHPHFAECVRRARAAVGPDVRLVVATNGVSMTEELAASVAPYNLRVYVSLHRPERAGPAIEILRTYGLLDGVSTDPSVSAIDWAGQVKWHVSAAERACPWIREGWAFVMADGHISSCCIDSSGAGVIGDVDAEPGSLFTKPYSLCPSCDQQIAIEGYTQSAGALPIVA